MRFRLRTLLIVLAVVAALVALGVVEWADEGVGQAVRSLYSLKPKTEQHAQEVKQLTAP